MKTRTLIIPLVALLAAASAALATPLACTGTCSILSDGFGYIPPVVEIASGADVVWGSLDAPHVHAETAVPDEGTPCFEVDSSVGFDSPPVRFAIVPGGLAATTDPDGGAEVRACASATALENGSYLLPYHCVIHPTMRGWLVVSPT